MSLSAVWRPGTIGPLELPHRIVMGSMHLGLEGLNDRGAALAAFYAERVRGGAGLIVTGGSAISRVGAGGRNYSFVNDDASAAGLARVADAVHDEGGRVLLQLFHAGRYAFEDAFGLQPVAPSAVYSGYSRCEPRAMSHDEIVETIGDFARGAARAVGELGFDGVEIMGSEGYLLNQFLAPATNLRDDEWGGDAARRMRFSVEVARAVREAAGPGAAVVYRISGADLVEGGTAAEDIFDLAGVLSDGLVDALNVGIGWHEARVPTVQLLVPPGAWRPWARALREAVDVPVIASNRINTLALAEETLVARDADFVSLARPFLADPSIVDKGRGGSGRVVNVCIACDQACIDRSIFDRRVSCVVNPRAGHELEAREVDGAGRSVAVVGGGPAGMEAARALAAAGFGVTLFEAADALGGQFRMASRIPGKEDYGLTGPYFADELGRLGVEMTLGTAVAGADELHAYDGVVVATGVVPAGVDIPGCDLPHVISYAQLLSAGAEVPEGASVAIIGAGGIGVDVAHKLSHSTPTLEDFYARYRLRDGGAPRDTHRRVTLMRRGKRVGERIGPSTRWAVVSELRMAGVELLTEVTYERIEPGVMHVRDASGAAREVPADRVIVCAGQRPERSLAVSLEAAGMPHLVIGGAHKAEELDAERAFREGWHVPARLGQLIGSRA